jgi:hypothetical protein
MTPEERRDIAARQAARGGNLVKTGNPLGTPVEQPQAQTPAAETPQYNYRTDLGIFGDPRYEYQVGDEFSRPGDEPPPGTPEWNDWKRHAAAWRKIYRRSTKLCKSNDWYWIYSRRFRYI